MAEYTPAYEKLPPLTVEHLDARLVELRGIYAYATSHDDRMVLDELFCAIVTLDHRLVLREREHDGEAHVVTSRKELDRALKWAWLAREEDEHAHGMYADKLKEAIAILDEVHAFLEGQRPQGSVAQAFASPAGMMWDEAEALATTIKSRLPAADVEVKRDDAGAWVVEARNPRRGTSQTFRSAEQFEELMQTARR